jgi:acyl carrier protein
LQAIRAHWPDLDLLVGFSSAGALFGSAGQAAHTAASAALDTALAQVALAGHPALAIDWGAWRDRGAAAERGATAALGPGMGTIGVADGFAALDRALASGVAHVAVLPIDQVAMRAAGVEPALLREASRVAEAVIPPAAPATSGPAEMAPDERRAWLDRNVAAECSAMLAIRGTIERRRPLQELGLDSLAALELRNRLGRLVGAVLPASLLFDYPTVAALVEHLGSYFGLDQRVAAARPAPAALLPVDDDALESASDDDLDAALSAFAVLHGDVQ